MLVFALAFMATGLCLGNPFPGLWKIWSSGNALVTDAAARGGLPAALFNGGLMALLSGAVLFFAGARPAGRAFSPFFACLAAGLLGANPLTALPILLGGLLYAAVRREPMGRVLPYTLQGFALTPAVAAFYQGSTGHPTPWSILLGIFAGLTAGFFCRPLALSTRPVHQGFNLYSMGLPLGVMAPILFGVYEALTGLPPSLSWNHTQHLITGQAYPQVYLPLLALLFGGLCLAGLLLGRSGGASYSALLAHAGLEADFLSLFGLSGLLLNMGVMGLLFLGVFVLFSIPLDGLALAALFFGLCCSGAGAHPRNIAPIFLGYCLAALFMRLPLRTPSLVMGLGFSAGLAPLGSKTRLPYGILAGFFHACLMPSILGYGGGFNLMTGSLACAMVALALFPMLRRSRQRYERRAWEAEASMPPQKEPEPGPGLPEAPRPARSPGFFLRLRNIFACLAALLFILTLVPGMGLGDSSSRLRALAYILGAVAYGAEILMLTHFFQKKAPLQEMLMPYLFGVLYIALGLGYLLGH